MIKMPDKKLPVEINGTMSTKGTDRAGLLMAIGWMVDKLLWRITFVIAVFIMMNIEKADATVIASEFVDRPLQSSVISVHAPDVMV